MEIRLIKPDEAIAYNKISAASFIWKFDKEVDDKVEVPVLGAFHEGKLISGVELFDFKCNYCGNIIWRRTQTEDSPVLLFREHLRRAFWQTSPHCPRRCHQRPLDTRLLSTH